MFFQAYVGDLDYTKSGEINVKMEWQLIVHWILKSLLDMVTVEQSKVWILISVPITDHTANMRTITREQQLCTMIMYFTNNQNLDQIYKYYNNQPCQSNIHIERHDTIYCNQKHGIKYPSSFLQRTVLYNSWAFCNRHKIKG